MAPTPLRHIFFVCQSPFLNSFQGRAFAPSTPDACRGPTQAAQRPRTLATELPAGSCCYTKAAELFKRRSRFIISASPSNPPMPALADVNATARVGSEQWRAAPGSQTKKRATLKYADINSQCCHRDRPIARPSVSLSPSLSLQTGCKGRGGSVEAEEECQAPSSAEDGSVCAQALRCLRQNLSPWEVRRFPFRVVRPRRVCARSRASETAAFSPEPSASGI